MYLSVTHQLNGTISGSEHAHLDHRISWARNGGDLLPTKYGHIG